MSIEFFIILLISHFIGDFVLQSRKIATSKSSKISSLLIHLFILLMSLLPITFIAKIPLYIPVIYCVLHGIQDWFIWRWYKKIHSIRKTSTVFYEDYLFYTTIGFDSLLHNIVLILLFI